MKTKIIDGTKITFNKTEIMSELFGNHSVEAVKLTFDGEFDGKIEIKHAQNNILSELVFFGSCEIGKNTEVEIKPAVPVSASHIFVFLPSENVKIKSIDVFETDVDENIVTYPAYRDLELDGNYFLDTVSVFLPSVGYSHYSVFTSKNGRDFDLLAVKSNNNPTPKTGDIYSAKGREARFVRVYLEYNSSSPYAVIDDIQYSGKKSENPVISAYEPNVCDFENSPCNHQITEKDTFDEVYGIIKRRLGEKYCAWFDLKIEKSDKFDYFKLDNFENKILITANSGVSLATGLNHYLKYFCKVNISQVGDNAVMPEKIIPLDKPVFKETKAKIRYAYNYCTLSYSMAFWGEKEWRDELDWLALNGVNAVLDATAQEEVWRRFLKKLGYTHAEIKKYIAGPAYYAWAYMANLFGFGGPVHDSWFEKRTALARNNHMTMRALGIQPILQGYSGMVPPDIAAHDESVDVIKQGTWCSFTRPYMLVTTSPCFKKYAALFYESQREVYGDYSFMFATDPFHEGGIVGDLSLRDVAKEVLGQMLCANENAVWVIQSWQQNPSSELLAGIEDIGAKDHALVLDLYAEKVPNYINGGMGNENHGYKNEFNKTPWVFCMLNNFGGRLGLHGHLDNLAKNIPHAFNTCEKIAGIGITPEASVNNPVLYDFLFECVWQDNASENLPEKDLTAWLHSYCERRYGAKSTSAMQAWDILKETVYKSELNMLGQGAPESVVNARPSLKVTSASTWGNAVISYAKDELINAAKLLIKDFDILKSSRGYLYDVVTICQQILSNRAQDFYNLMVEGVTDGDGQAFEFYSEKFLAVADEMEEILSCSEYYMLGRWVNMAKALADGADDFSKRLYEFNAKSLITTWGAYNQSEIGQLHDYSNRQWAGLVGDFYKPRWEKWIENSLEKLNGEPADEGEPFEWEWNWVRNGNSYPDTPKELNLELVKNIIDGYEDI